MPLAPEIVVQRMIDGIEGLEMTENERANQNAILAMIVSAIVDTGFNVQTFDNIMPKELASHEPLQGLTISGMILSFWIFDSTIFVKRSFEGQTVHV